MANILYKATAKKAVCKLPAGAEVEIIKDSGKSAPNLNEIAEAFQNKYGAGCVHSCHCGSSNVTVTKIK